MLPAINRDRSSTRSDAGQRAGGGGIEMFGLAMHSAQPQASGLVKDQQAWRIDMEVDGFIWR